MSPKIPPEVVSIIINAMVYRTEGVIFDEIVAAFPEPPDTGQVEAWLAELKTTGLITVNHAMRPVRHNATRAGAERVTSPKASSNPSAPPKPDLSERGTEKPATTTSPEARPDQPAPSAGGSPGQSGGTPPETPKPATSLSHEEASSPQPPNTGSAARWSDLFDRHLPAIVGGYLPRVSALGYLQGIGTGLPDNEQAGFVLYGLSRLEHLSQGECARRGILPPQFALWHSTYFRSAHPVGGDVGGGAAMPSPDTAEPDSRGGTPEPDVDPVPEPQPEAGGGRASKARSQVTFDSKVAKADGTAPTARGSSTSTTHNGNGHAGGPGGGNAAGSKTPESQGSGSREFQGPAPWAVQGSTPAAVQASLMKLLGSRLVGAADWLIPGRLGRAEKTTLAGVAVPGLLALTPVIGVVPVVVLCAAWVMVCLLLRRRPESEHGAVPAVALSRNPASREGSDISASSLEAARESGGAAVLGGVPSGNESTDTRRLPKGPTATWHPALLIVSGLVLLSCFAAGWFYWKRSQVPSKAAVEAHLIKSVAPLPVRVPRLDIKPGGSTSMGLDLSYTVRFETTQPLYRRIDTMEYLKANAADELAAIAAADTLLKGANGERIRERLRVVGLGEPGSSEPKSATPSTSIVLVTTATPVGATAVTTGRLLAWNREGSWVFEGEPARVDRTSLSGEPKPPGAYAIDVPADEVRLKALLKEQVSLAARIQAAATELASELERNRQQRVARFADLLRSGTVFTGSASGVTTAGAIRVSLEIGSSSAGSSHVTALLRNDGGWSDARMFQGDWSLAADGDTCILTLRSGRNDRITGAGPLLEDVRDITVTVQVRSDGTGSGMPDNWQLRRVDPAEVPALRAGFSRSVAPALAATKPGLLYRGTVTSQTRPLNEVLMLRFTAQDPDGVRLEASLQSVTVASWVRPFRGSVIDNTYRAGSTPIRLRTLDTDRIAQAPTWSMLAWGTGNDGVGLNLRVEGARLIGQDDHFTYVFEPADPNRTEPLQAAASRSDPNRAATSGSTGSALPGQPIDRSTVPPIDGSAGANAPARRALPPFPGSVGAYVLSDDGQWVPLPRNNGRIVQSAVQKGNGFFNWLKGWQAQIAGTAVPESKDVTGQWMFDGTSAVPEVSGEDVVVIYAGPLIMSPALLNRYPQLAQEPLMEMAPLWVLDSGVRSVPLTSPAPKIFGFGPLRVPVTLDHPALAITLLHCTTRLPARHYAIACGDNAYELAVR